MPKKHYDFAGWATKNNIRCSDGRTIMHGAFSADNGKRVPLVWNHQHDNVRNVLGHADLEERPEGVYAYCSFNNTEHGQDAKDCEDHHKVNESDIHFDQKTIIHGKLKTVDIEGYIEHAVEKQVRRADIYVPEQVKVSNNLAIELQYAPISAEDVFKRQADYQDVDCRVLWLLGYQSTYHSIFDNNHKGPTSKTLNAVRPFLRYDYEFGFYLPFWHEASGKVVLLTVNLYGQGQKQIRMSIERYIDRKSTRLNSSHL